MTDQVHPGDDFLSARSLPHQNGNNWFIDYLTNSLMCVEGQFFEIGIHTMIIIINCWYEV